MKYRNIEQAVFVDRPNRFIANVLVNDRPEVCHVKNTGRCQELLRPGTTVYVERNHNPNRKTALDLITVCKEGTLVNVDSQIPNRVVEEWLRAGNLFTEITLIRPETKYQNSRFDLYLEADGQKIFVEIKGVTLFSDEIASFPDAPTLRGIKHIEELCGCMEEGYQAFIFFVIQLKGVKSFRPNDDIHPEFGESLRRAAKAGVNVLAYDCDVTKDEITIREPIPVDLS